MNQADFIRNLSGLNDGGDYPKDLLKNIHQSIQSEPLAMEL